MTPTQYPPKIPARFERMVRASSSPVLLDGLGFQNRHHHAITERFADQRPGPLGPLQRVGRHDHGIWFDFDRGQHGAAFAMRCREGDGAGLRLDSGPIGLIVRKPVEECLALLVQFGQRR